MRKLSRATFRKISAAISALLCTSIIGWPLFWAMGYGREYYQTSTPEELYGIFGWFSISYYCGTIALICITAILLLVAIGLLFFDLSEEAELGGEG